MQNAQTNVLLRCKESAELTAAIPLKWVGPIAIWTNEKSCEEIAVPLATFETPLWPSVQRGGRISLLSNGIQTTVMDERMSRSILFETACARESLQLHDWLKAHRNELAIHIQKTSRFIELLDTHVQFVGHLVYLRLEVKTGDAAGHNMVTKAADSLLDWILQHHPSARHLSVSGNFCTDKKASAVNGILGRGKYVIAEMTIAREICEKQLRTTPELLVELNVKKNLIGTILAGGVRSANAHFANMLLAFYLATGQDAANIIEGSQGIVHAEVKPSGCLYFSVTLPNIIVGSIGNGKEHAFVHDNLKQLGCTAEREKGENGRRLAQIIAATVLCGELSLLAAQTNPRELMRAHLAMERTTRQE